MYDRRNILLDIFHLGDYFNIGRHENIGGYDRVGIIVECVGKNMRQRHGQSETEDLEPLIGAGSSINLESRPNHDLPCLPPNEGEIQCQCDK